MRVAVIGAKVRPIPQSSLTLQQCTAWNCKKDPLRAEVNALGPSDLDGA